KNPPELPAHQLAKTHASVSWTKGRQLFDRLPDLQGVLRAAYERFRDTPSQNLTFSFAGEWMLDNFYIIEETIRQIQEDLPQHYYVQLPKLLSSYGEGYPRVYRIAVELVASCASRLDLDQIREFTRTYQQITPLMMGELWALPTMLRLSILESLADTVAHI